MIKSSIDIGSNTCLLLVADVHDDGNLTVLDEQQFVPRLGRGVDADRNLAQSSIENVIEALKSYKSYLEEHYPNSTHPIVTATSAVRDANNRDEFIDLVKQEVGFDVQVISGETEAQLTSRGALAVLEKIDLSEDALILDIGGGSTECIHYKNGTILNASSLDIGCVRFTERYLGQPPVVQDDIDHSWEEARKAFLSLNWLTELSESDWPVQLVGVAGTVTSIAYIKHKLKEYDSGKLNDKSIYVQDINDLLALFKNNSEEEITAMYPEVMTSRADIFTAGLTILKTFMEVVGVDECVVSTGGVRHGAVLMLESDNL